MGLQGLAVIIALGLACDSKKATKCEGTERCECYPNGTCDTGLVCLSDMCVSTTSSTGGSAVGGGGGGAVGTGGVVLPGTGGATTVVPGGMPATGGLAVLTGGMPATGGLMVVTGGMPATGGLTVAECRQGAERCDCYPNLTCNAGLVCLSSMCVSMTNTGGAVGTGGMLGGGAGGLIVTTGGMFGGGAGGSTLGTGGTVVGNMIKNGDFSLGKTYWDLTYQAGEYAGQLYTGGEYCIYNLSDLYYLSFSLGYPSSSVRDAFALQTGATYTLSYRVKGSGDIEAKIGEAVLPYTSLASFTDSIFSPGVYVTKSHLVLSTTSSAQAGLVFNGTLYYSESVCFDDVVLVKN